MASLEEEITAILNRGHRVHEWPDDEAAAYRDNGGFDEGRAAVDAIRVQKILELAEVEELRQAYEDWKNFGERAHAVLLEIWHEVTPYDTAHMTYGNNPNDVARAFYDYQRRQKK